MIVLYKLILAHLAGDFLLQPNAWVQAKEAKKLAAYQLYLHVLIHGLLVWLLVWEPGFWKWALLLAIFHWAIDAAKLQFQKPATKRTVFFLDQLAHIVSIYFIWRWYFGDIIRWEKLGEEPVILLAIMVIFVTTPCSYFVKVFISKWIPEQTIDTAGSLQNAGKYIGIIERLFVFTFIATNNIAAVGFLITAKSVFRFGDLREAKDRKLTEYVLIGTLSSFGIAMLCAAIYRIIS